MIDAVVALTPTPGLTAGACAALNLSRASVYRQRRHLARPQAVPRSPPRLLRLLPAGATLAGRDLHPLKNCAFPRHTTSSSLRPGLGFRYTQRVIARSPITIVQVF